jgi:uncharacterized protein YkwD
MPPSGRPLTLKRAILILAVALAAALPASAAPQRLESSLLGEINTLRVLHGLAPLRVNPGLQAAARQHSLEMARDGYFAHESHDGSLFWQRIERYYRPPGAGRWETGENLLWAGHDLGAHEALQRWLRSPQHRAVLLRRDWREIGLRAVRTIAPGFYGGRTVTIVTVDFGVRG